MNYFIFIVVHDWSAFIETSLDNSMKVDEKSSDALLLSINLPKRMGLKELESLMGTCSSV